MPTDLNPGQKAKKANDDFHEAVQAIMLDEGLGVDMKVRYTAACDTVFRQMQSAQDIIKAHYEPEGQEE